MKKQIDKSVLITLIVVLGILVLALIGIGFFNSTNPKNTISATGTSTIKVLPDSVGIYFNVQTEALTAKEASDKNAEIVDEMKKSLMEIGFTEEEIQTQSFSINPSYDYSGGKQRITGYFATHSIKINVLVNEKEKISGVLDSGIAAGAGISYINYEINEENQKAYKAEAIKKATEDAKTKAEALASGAGEKLGSLVSVSTSDFNYVPWLAFSDAQVKSGTEIATQITPSEQEVSASVTAVFRIG